MDTMTSISQKLEDALNIVKPYGHADVTVTREVTEEELFLFVHSFLLPNQLRSCGVVYAGALDDIDSTGIATLVPHVVKHIRRTVQEQHDTLLADYRKSLTPRTRLSDQIAQVAKQISKELSKGNPNENKVTEFEVKINKLTILVEEETALIKSAFDAFYSIALAERYLRSVVAIAPAGTQGYIAGSFETMTVDDTIATLKHNLRVDKSNAMFDGFTLALGTFAS